MLTNIFPELNIVFWGEWCSQGIGSHRVLVLLTEPEYYLNWALVFTAPRL